MEKVKDDNAKFLMFKFSKNDSESLRDLFYIWNDLNRVQILTPILERMLCSGPALPLSVEDLGKQLMQLGQIKILWHSINLFDES